MAFIEFDTIEDLLAGLDDIAVGCAEAASHYRSGPHHKIAAKWEKARDAIEVAARKIESVEAQVHNSGEGGDA